MLKHADVYAAHQHARWMRPDAARYAGLDAAKSLKRDSYPADVDPALADHRIALEGLHCHLTQIKFDLAWRRLRDAIDQKYSASQARVPAGSGRESGRWTSGGGGSSSGASAQGAGDGDTLDEIVVDGSEVDSAFDGDAGNDDAFGSGHDVTWDDWAGWQNNETLDDERPTRINDTRILNDADPEPVRPGERYAANGHHPMPQALFDKWNLPPETRKVFDKETTGQLPGRTIIRFSPEGVPISHSWNKAHRDYNKAVEELSNSFLSRNDITPRTMTPSQAKQLLEEIRNSSDPRISDFNELCGCFAAFFNFVLEDQSKLIMAQSDDAQQDRDWQVLHDLVTTILDRHGVKDAFGDGDYWLVDDNWGCVQQIEFQNLDLFKPDIIRELQAELAAYPNWSITIRVDVVGKEKEWPGMGIIIYPNEVFDELQRNYLPERFQTMIFGTIPPPPETQEQLADKVRKLMKPRP